MLTQVRIVLKIGVKGAKIGVKGAKIGVKCANTGPNCAKNRCERC